MKIEEWSIEPHDISVMRFSALIPKKAVPTKGTPIDLTIKPWREKRSLSANAYMWTLCAAIAEKMGGITKEDIYREGVRHAGVVDFQKVQARALQRFMRIWEGNGMGYIVEPLEEVGADPFAFIECAVYTGSSAYNTSQMGKLLTFIVDEAEALGIDTRPPAERAEMLEEWRQVNG